MKRLILAASIALALTPALAFASPSPQGWSQDHGRHGHDRRDRRGDDRYDARYDARYQHDRRPVYRHDNGRHLGWYKRGGRVPVVYLQPRYYVTDYRAYDLAPPLAFSRSRGGMNR
jgi:Ni/Co efflux regulator RcnB